MDYFWIVVRCIEDLAVGLLLFGLLTACVARWRIRLPAFAVLALFVLCVVGFIVMAIAAGHRLFLVGPHFAIMKNLLIAAVMVHCIGYFTIGWFGLRRRDRDGSPAAATWLRSRLLLAFLVALALNAVTHWNFSLAVQQRLARAEVEARVTALSVLHGRPIDSLNAAVLYEPVFERLLKPDHKDDWLDFDKPLDTDDPGLRKMLASHRGDLDALVQASTRAQCYFGIHQPRDFFSGDGDGEWIGSMFGAGKLLAVDIRVKIARGDLDGAARNTSALFRMARHSDQAPLLIAALVGGAIERLGNGCVQELLNHPDISAEMLSGLQLEERADYRRILRRSLAFEEAASTTLVKRISAEGFAFLGDEVGEPGQRDALGTFLWKTTNVYFIEHELEVFRSLYHEMRALLKQPWSEVSDEIGQFRSKRYGGVLSQVIFPVWEGVAVRAMIGDARYRQARLALAMRQYESEHGDLPTSFDDLIPAYIGKVPLDPSTEKPFKIENVDGGVRLYSDEIDPKDFNLDDKVEMFLKSQ